MATFPDIANLSPESQAAIERRVRAGMLRGYADGTFKPFANLTREQAALLLDRQSRWAIDKAAKFAKSTLSIFDYNYGTGAGFFVEDTSGMLHIITARHVIATLYAINDNTTIWATNERRHLYVRAYWGLLRSDATDELITILTRQETTKEDLALLRITDKMRSLLPAEVPVIHLSGGDPEVGEDVVCIGSPLNFDNTVTTGKVARGCFEHYAHPGEWIFVSAGINPGNSGGPVFSVEDKTIGMALMKSWYRSAFGMAPVDDLGWVITAKAIRAWAKREWGLDLK